MSAALVRKALEISSDSVPAIVKTSTKKKSKRKKKTTDHIEKQNLKVLKALEFATKYKQRRGGADTSTKKQKKNEEDSSKSVFTEEDFAKFEREYFVTE